MAEIAGLKLIVPSSVAGSGVSVSASGKVTFTAATTISMNGIFSSTYDNYLIVSRFKGNGNTPFRARVRASGTDNTTSNSYVFQYLDVNGTAVGGARVTGTSVQNGFIASTIEGGSHFYVYGPFLSQPTAFRSVTIRGTSYAFITEDAGTHNQSTSYDGLTLFANDGTTQITGALTVYGLSQ